MPASEVGSKVGVENIDVSNKGGRKEKRGYLTKVRDQAYHSARGVLELSNGVDRSTTSKVRGKRAARGGGARVGLGKARAF